VCPWRRAWLRDCASAAALTVAPAVRVWPAALVVAPAERGGLGDCARAEAVSSATLVQAQAHARIAVLPALSMRRLITSPTIERGARLFERDDFRLGVCLSVNASG
jgi:hypothetical protein